MVVVEGGSMAPTLAPGDILWIDTSPRGLPAIDELVMVRDPVDSTRLLIKRVRSRGGNSFAVGSDDPTQGRDSRHFGSLDATHLVGRVSRVCSLAGI